MAKFRLSKKALQDLSNIWDYTFDEWSERQADKYYDLLLAFCKEIADNKLHGKHYPEIGEEILGLKALQHVIFYRVLKNEFQIVRILHFRMDFKNRLTE